MATFAIKYLVKHDTATGRWNVFRGDQPTGAFARDMYTAIGAATHQASLEARDTDIKVTVWLEQDGKAKKVWPLASAAPK